MKKLLFILFFIPVLASAQWPKFNKAYFDSIFGLHGKLHLQDSTYISKASINSVLGTTGTKAIKSLTTVDINTLGFVLNTDTTFVRTIGDTIYGNLSFRSADINIYNVSNNALKFGTNNTERINITNAGEVLVSATNNAAITSTMQLGSNTSALSLPGDCAFLLEKTLAGGPGKYDRGIVIHTLQDANADGNSTAIMVAPAIKAGVTQTSQYGIYMSPYTAGNIGSFYGIYIDAKTGGGTVTNNYDAIFNGSASIGIGTAAPTYNIGFGGTAARTFGMQRNTTANAKGQGFNFWFSGASLNSTNKGSDPVIFNSQITTGTGHSQYKFMQVDRLPYGTTATTTDNSTQRTRFFLTTTKPLRKAVADTILSVVIGADSTFSCLIAYGCGVYNNDSSIIDRGTLSVGAAGASIAASEVVQVNSQKFKVTGTTFALTPTISVNPATKTLYLIVTPTSNTGIASGSGTTAFSDINIDITGLNLSGRYTSLTFY